MSAPLGLRSLNVYYTFVYYTRYCYYLCYFRTNQQYIEYPFEEFGVLTKFNHRFLNDHPNASIESTSRLVLFGRTFLSLTRNISLK